MCQKAIARLEQNHDGLSDSPVHLFKLFFERGFVLLLSHWGYGSGHQFDISYFWSRWQDVLHITGDLYRCYDLACLNFGWMRVLRLVGRSCCWFRKWRVGCPFGRPSESDPVLMSGEQAGGLRCRAASGQYASAKATGHLRYEPRSFWLLHHHLHLQMFLSEDGDDDYR